MVRTLQKREEALRVLHDQQIFLLREWRARCAVGDAAGAEDMVPDLLVSVNAISSGLRILEIRRISSIFFSVLPSHFSTIGHGSSESPSDELRRIENCRRSNAPVAPTLFHHRWIVAKKSVTE